jgi:transposase-like protein
MGTRAIYECNDCKKQFESIDGGSFRAIWLRCERCDNVQTVSNSEWPSLFQVAGVLNRPLAESKYESRQQLAEARSRFICDVCKSQLCDDLKPMCPVCRTRNVIEKQVLLRFD